MLGTIVYCCPYVPAEWIAAHGFEPRRITPNVAVEMLSFPTMGVCPYAAAFAGICTQLEGVSGIVVTTTCDQMRRMAERIESQALCPVFTMHVPTAMHAFGLYREEVQRLGRFLQRLGGTKPSPGCLAEMMSRFDAARKALRSARTRMSPREFSERILRFQAGDWTALDKAPKQDKAHGVPVALVGGPLTESDMVLFEMIEQAGGRVALDATATGERGLPRSFDEAALRNDPFEELIDAYFHSMTDAFRRPNDALYLWLRHFLSERGVRGLILFHYVWCDTWQAEGQRMRDRLDVPILILDAGEHNAARMTGRIAAFLEALQ